MRVLLVSFVGIALVAGSAAVAQEPVSAAPTGTATMSEIHIDHSCRVLTPRQPTKTNPNPQPSYRYDSVVCHIESNLQSVHREKMTVEGVSKNVPVSVTEREYLLQNTTDQPVVFLVDYRLRKGWKVDSDPQPVEVKGNVATFRVMAEPKQIVRLHVGSRS